MHVHHLRDGISGHSGGGLYTEPLPLREQEARLGVGVGTMGGSEFQRKKEFCPQGHKAFGKCCQGRTEPLWSDFLVEGNWGYY